MVARLFGVSAGDARRDSAAVLEQMGLSDDADRPVRSYSGGMRRRSTWAPASSDIRGSSSSMNRRPGSIRAAGSSSGTIRSLVASGTDVLPTTQYLDEADHLASQIAIIDHGRVVAAGTPRELKRRAGRNVVEVRVRDLSSLDRVAAS